MPTNRSERVMEQRKRDYDQVSFVISKGGKYLARAQALREGVTVAEMIRRAILARCGLESMPDFTMPHYHNIVAASDKESAERAIDGLQRDEYIKRHLEEKPDDDVYMTVMLASQGMKDEYIKALLDLLDALEDTTPALWDDAWNPPTEIKITKKTLAIVRRLLSNIESLTYDNDIDADT